MPNVNAAAFFALVAGRRGHFLLESGYHGNLWLDLDPLFAEPRRINPFVEALAALLRPYQAAVVCGPLLGGAFLAQLLAQVLDAEFVFTERVMPPRSGVLYPAGYQLPAAFAHRLSGRRVALVDDVMSAGSALRGTYSSLQTHGAVPVVAGALLTLGGVGAAYFAERNIPVETLAREPYDLWLPGNCPLCAAGMPLEDLAGVGVV